jgi:hypothetical protein
MKKIYKKSDKDYLVVKYAEGFCYYGFRSSIKDCKTKPLDNTAGERDIKRYLLNQPDYVEISISPISQIKIKL